MQSLVQTKTCTTCRIPKPLNDFHNNPHGRLGKQSRCKSCQVTSTKRWRRESTDSYLRGLRKIARKNKAYWRTHNPYEETKTRFCPHCIKERPSLDFDECYGVSSGLQSWCRECGSTRIGNASIESRLLWSAKNRSKSKGIPFAITVKDIVVPDVCPVLGIPLYIKKGKAGPNSPSLDRIENKKGYVQGNICVISYRANLLKGDAAIDEVRKLLLYMEKHAK